MKPIRLLLACVVLTACGCDGNLFSSSGSHNGEPEDQSCNHSGINWNYWSVEDPVWLLNAQYFGGRTVRWADGYIYVRVADGRINTGRLQAIFDDINSRIGAARLTLWSAASPRDPDIEIQRNSAIDRNFGLTNYQIWPDYYFQHALVSLGDFDDIDCLFYAVVKHELLHAVGIIGHVLDGGVMNGRELMGSVHNDVITPIVDHALRTLYSLPAFTEVDP